VPALQIMRRTQQPADLEVVAEPVWSIFSFSITPNLCSYSPDVRTSGKLIRDEVPVGRALVTLVGEASTSTRAAPVSGVMMLPSY